MSKQPYHECPSFERCSCNACPLDPLKEQEGRIRLFKEDKCVAYKPTRFKIGSKYPNLLPYQGLTKQEWVGKNMSQVERDKKREFFLQLGIKRQKTQKSGILQADATLNSLIPKNI